MSGLLAFQLQSGVFKENVTVDGPEISLKDLRERAVSFVNQKYPDHKFGEILGDHLLLYRHDLRSINILQLISTAADVVDGTLVEIVISSTPQHERLVVHPHTLYVHSYKVPTFCDFCGEMLFGLVKQGLKCQGCGLNFHKRCASKVPNNCSGARQRRPSAIPLSPRNSVGMQQTPSTASSTAGSQTAPPFPQMPLSARLSAALGGPPRPSPSASQLNAPDIMVTGEDVDGSGGSLLAPMPRKDRSSSWSGRPLWMEVADATRVKVPHTFQVHSYTRPTVCMDCKKLLKGLIRQGLQCRDCKYNCHKKCEVHVPKDCPGNILRSPSFMLGSDQNFESGVGSSVDSLSMTNSLGLDDGSEDLDLPDTPTAKTLAEATSAPPWQPAQDSEGGEVGEGGGEEDDTINESQNIPLMRIVMSKKQTKRPGQKFLKGGWMVHHTDKNNMEIPLSDILSIKSVVKEEDENEHPDLEEQPTHCLEIKTGSCIYFIAGVPEKDQTEVSREWEAAVKRALMPVTPQSSSGSHANQMATLKIPSPGETGHLGLQIQSEQEFSLLYQIFADEILGSGQFGTVYGGIQRKNGKHVAVKVIDKLKFPSNKEAALRTEVDILQKVRHGGVVEFQQMLETPDRIFVVMEKLKGDMLEMILSSERGRLSERITKFIIHQILISLKYLHSQNIVHCDLKPENILLTSDSDFPQVKLCDFGFARIIGERSFRRSVVGTPAYLAPEVLRNKGFNRSLDMWSVGVIVYVSLSGTFPFNEDEDINDQIQNAEFMYPPNPWREISSDGIEFINSLLQVKMNKRLTVHKSLAHIWLQSYQVWSDLRCLEKEVNERYLSHESDDARWQEYEKARGIKPCYL